MWLQPETSRGSDTCIQLAPWMPNPEWRHFLRHQWNRHIKSYDHNFYWNAAFLCEGSTKGSEIWPGLFPRRSSTITFSTERSNYRKKLEFDFVVHRDNSMCDNARKISLELGHNKIERVSHPADSPDINPCDFWLSAFLKKLKEQEL
jgi:hypothetical protein